MTTTWGVTPPTTPDFDSVGMMLAGAERELAALEQASPTDASAVQRFRNAGQQMRQAALDYDSRASQILEDPRLSEQGRSEKRDALQDILRSEVNTALILVQDTHEQLERATAWTPPALAEDAMLAEAQLQTARMDATQLLERVQDKDLPDTLRDIAEDPSTPEPLRHLILHTTWPAMFMRGRGMDRSAREAWEHYATIIIPRILPEPERRAYQRHAAVKRHAGKAVMVLRHAAEFALVNRNARQARDE